MFSQSGQWDGTPAANTRTPFAVVYLLSVHFTHSDDPPLHIKEVNHKMWCKSLSLWLACYHQDATSRLCYTHTHTHTLTHTHTHTLTHSHTHTRTHARTHARTHTHTRTHASGLPIIFMLLSQTANINRLSNCNENILHRPVCVWERDRLFFQSETTWTPHTPDHRLQEKHKSNTFMFISLTSLANCLILF